MPDPQPTTPPAAPVLPEKTQIAVSRAITIGVNVLMTWLVTKGWASQDEASQYGLILTGLAVGAVGNVATAVWSYVRRKWLALQPAPDQTVAANQAKPVRVVLDYQTTARMLAAELAPLLAPPAAKPKAAKKAKPKPPEPKP